MALPMTSATGRRPMMSAGTANGGRAIRCGMTTQDPATRQLINEEGVADDGRSWTTTYDVNDIYTWTSQTNWFDSNGDIDYIVTV